MVTIEKYINAFRTQLSHISFFGGNNVALAGSCVLELHGLKLGWEPQDLDVVIYQPLEWQIEYVERLMSKCSTYESEQQERERCVYELESEGLKMNVFLAFNEHIAEDLLTYQGLNVNSVSRIVAAKNSYRKHNYLRAKDVIHLQQLKNNNFNASITPADTSL